VGTAAAMGALGVQSAAGFFLASAVAGSGFGAGFQGAMRTVLPTAKAHERAGVLSVVFVVSYLAMAIPAIVAGFFVSHGGALLPTAQHFGFVVEALAAFALLGTLLEGKARATWNATAPRRDASPRGGATNTRGKDPPLHCFCAPQDVDDDEFLREQGPGAYRLRH